MYYNAPITILDDSLSALDAHVGHKVFRNVIGPGGFLHRRGGQSPAKGEAEEKAEGEEAMMGTRVLVTHAEWVLGECDIVVRVESGKVVSIKPGSEFKGLDSVEPEVEKKAKEEEEAEKEVEAVEGEAGLVAPVVEKKEKGAALMQSEERQTGSISGKSMFLFLLAL